jgi:hypothetical protein
VSGIVRLPGGILEKEELGSIGRVESRSRFTHPKINSPTNGNLKSQAAKIAKKY